ncbi:MAG: M48 family metallopeptidase [Zetaproteobacteria bacterium]|nr:M48 family metallopeptidase [Zetaproteobacteria bacterium]
MKLPFPYTLKRSARRKRLAITIADGKVVVAIPAKMSAKQALAFIQEKRGWVEEKLAWQLEKKAQTPAFTFQEGDQFSYLGERYGLQVELGSEDVALVGNMIKVVTTNDEPQGVRQRLLHWYYHRAQAYMTQRIAYFSPCLGVPSPSFVGVKHYKSRWGVCYEDGRIFFHWGLMMAPAWVVDDVIVHELAHLQHMNHSKDFWALVATVSPDYKASTQWLKEHGSFLNF